jgi:hypothetical protein
VLPGASSEQPRTQSRRDRLIFGVGTAYPEPTISKKSVSVILRLNCNDDIRLLLTSKVKVTTLEDPSPCRQWYILRHCIPVTPTREFVFPFFVDTSPRGLKASIHPRNFEASHNTGGRRERLTLDSQGDASIFVHQPDHMLRSACLGLHGGFALFRPCLPGACLMVNPVFDSTS